MWKWTGLAVAALGLAACGRDIVGTPGSGRTSTLPTAAAGAVYTSNNSASTNYVIIFARAATGTLVRLDSVATGGRGSGRDPQFGTDPLGSQDALILDSTATHLFVVNAGSDQVSSFRVGPGGLLTLVSVVPSGGHFPVSLAIRGDLLYVVNGKLAPNISGFHVAASGALTPLAGSTQRLPGVEPGPGSIRISPERLLLVVTERELNQLALFPLSAAGLPGAPTVMPSPGPTPFGADFDERGHYILAQGNVLLPRNPVPNASSVSSFRVVSFSSLGVVSASVPTQQTAACWILITPGGQFAYSSNTGSGSISGFSIGAGGALTPLSANGQTGLTGPGTQPLDMAFAGGFLYVVTAGDGGIHGFLVGGSGTLTPVSAVTGTLPARVEGLAGF